MESKEEQVKEGNEVITDNCPSDDFEQGTPSGKCWGDGHYRCQDCVHYREDFKRLGQDFIDFCHDPRFQPVHITTL